MVKLPILKRVVLPNNRTFYPKFRMVTREALRIRRTRRRCSPRAQRGRWIKIVLRAGFKLVKKNQPRDKLVENLEKVLLKTLHEHNKLVLVK